MHLIFVFFLMSIEMLFISTQNICLPIKVGLTNKSESECFFLYIDNSYSYREKLEMLSKTVVRCLPA